MYTCYSCVYRIPRTQSEHKDNGKNNEKRAMQFPSPYMKLASCGSENPSLVGSGTGGVVCALTRFQINVATGFCTSVAQKCLHVHERDRMSAGDVE